MIPNDPSDLNSNISIGKQTYEPLKGKWKSGNEILAHLLGYFFHSFIAFGMSKCK